MKEDIWTIEINLDEDYAYACAYHIDLLTNVSALNLREACEKKKTSRWAIVGIATTIESANEQCKLIREELCKMHNREIYGIGLLNKEEEEEEEVYKRNNKILHIKNSKRN